MFGECSTYSISICCANFQEVPKELLGDRYAEFERLRENVICTQ